MDKPEQRTVVYSPLALGELDAIWQWNATTYGVQWADNYVQFLQRGIYDLATTGELGRPVGTSTDLKYRLFRRRSKGHGHVVVYRIAGNTIRVLHIFHTARNWHETSFDK